MAHADWSALIAQHTHAVVLSLLARGVRLGRARQLADETWSLLYERHQAGLLPTLELPGLAIRQAGFLALKEVAARRAVSLDEAPEAGWVPTREADAEARAMARQQLQLVHAHLAQLPPRAKHLFTLHLEHPEAGHAQLAEQVGVSLQRFRQTLCEVRARLRRAVEGGEP